MSEDALKLGKWLLRRTRTDLGQGKLMLLSPLHFGEIIDEERLNLNFWIFLETKLQGDNTFLTVTF